MGALFSICTQAQSAEATLERRNQQIKRILTYTDVKGFKKCEDVREKYTILEPLGKGSFGEVRKAELKQLGIPCAIKLIKKSAVQKHQILQDLMSNELKVLEETVRI